MITRAQVDAANLDPHLLTRWVRQGRAERLQRGVYRHTGAPGFPHEDLLEVQLRIPTGGVPRLRPRPPRTDHLRPEDHRACRAAQAQTPEARVPRHPRALLQPAHLRLRHRTAPVGKRNLRVYNAEKTLADLLRFRQRLGNDLFAEGLKRYFAPERIRERRPDRLLEAARVCRVETLMRELMEVSALDLSS
ncbi:MAG: type IV toxin-antitoxin system AbiEi family antitoxin domain-containing protein [Pleurocapsa sp. SU_196_0]|nr:type IV toxin-antitoxin system AbiEi family antitoxin domain-containing protein [Pleurocapsa sp. SU_196_0]